MMKSEDDFESYNNLPVTDHNPKIFRARNLAEPWTSQPHKKLEGWFQAHIIVPYSTGPTSYANGNVEDVASAFSLFFRDATLLLIGVYKSMGELISQLWSRYDGRPICWNFHQGFIMRLWLINGCL